MAITFEVSRILMHGDVDNAIEYWEDLVLGFQTFLKLQIFVPERVG